MAEKADQAFTEQVELIAQQVASDPEKVKEFSDDADGTIEQFATDGQVDRAKLKRAVASEVSHKVNLDTRASQLADQIATSPGLRTTYFRDAVEAFSKVAPKPIVFDRAGTAKWEELKVAVLQRVPDDIYSKAPMEAAANRADRIQDKFFSAAIRNPERSFNTILNTSIATFIVGIGLIITGTVLGITGNDTTQEVVISSVFTGTGVAGVLGTIYSLVRRGIRLSNANHAQIRVILTAFSFELSRLLAYDPEKDNAKSTNLKNTQKVNDGIRDAMETAVKLIQNNVKVEEGDEQTSTVDTALSDAAGNLAQPSPGAQSGLPGATVAAAANNARPGAGGTST